MKSNRLLFFRNLFKGAICGFVLSLILLTSGLQSQDISSVGEIYDFEVGDIFHTHYFQSFPAGNWYGKDYNYEILDRFYSQNNQNLSYVRDIAMREADFGNPNWSYSYYTDTVTYYNVDSLINFGYIDSVYYNNNLYSGRLINEYKVDIPYNIYTITHFVNGCGMAKFNSINYGGQSSLSELVYFNKGGEEWGTPNWLTVSVENMEAKLPEISIYPNPVKDQLYLSTENFSNAMVSLYSMAGNQIKTYALNSNLTSIDVSGLSPGIYTLIVRSEKQVIHEILIKE